MIVVKLCTCSTCQGTFISLDITDTNTKMKLMLVQNYGWPTGPAKIWLWLARRPFGWPRASGKHDPWVDIKPDLGKIIFVFVLQIFRTNYLNMWWRQKFFLRIWWPCILKTQAITMIINTSRKWNYNMAKMEDSNDRNLIIMAYG